MATLPISYMGSKRALAPQIAEIIEAQRPGPVLDVFCGTCAVADAIAARRPVWCSDLQEFATLIARAFFTYGALTGKGKRALRDLVEIARQHQRKLQAAYNQLLELERKYLHSESAKGLSKLEEFCFADAQSCDAGVDKRVPYELFVSRYSASYLGVEQCIELDSIRFALDQATENKLISAADRHWILLGCCLAAYRCSATTGHFAQHLHCNSSNKSRYAKQRRRSIIDELLASVPNLTPSAPPAFRKLNRSIRGEALASLRRLASRNTKPSVVYADPPYTAEHYSRYYHFYETVILYDRPAVAGRGRYRADRQPSPFSFKSTAREALYELASAVSGLDATLILSYPSKGLLPAPKSDVLEILTGHFKNVTIEAEIPYQHSSLGASKGKSFYSATEILFRAK